MSYVQRILPFYCLQISFQLAIASIVQRNLFRPATTSLHFTSHSIVHKYAMRSGLWFDFAHAFCIERCTANVYLAKHNNIIYCVRLHNSFLFAFVVAIFNVLFFIFILILIFFLSEILFLFFAHFIHPERHTTTEHNKMGNCFVLSLFAQMMASARMSKTNYLTNTKKMYLNSL